jgi:hypothetical protein
MKIKAVRLSVFEAVWYFPVLFLICLRTLLRLGIASSDRISKQRGEKDVGWSDNGVFNLMPLSFLEEV